jgi:hypothetical protein
MLFHTSHVTLVFPQWTTRISFFEKSTTEPNINLKSRQRRSGTLIFNLLKIVVPVLMSDTTEYGSWERRKISGSRNHWLGFRKSKSLSV